MLRTNIQTVYFYVVHPDSYLTKDFILYLKHIIIYYNIIKIEARVDVSPSTTHDNSGVILASTLFFSFSGLIHMKVKDLQRKAGVTD